MPENVDGLRASTDDGAIKSNTKLWVENDTGSDSECEMYGYWTYSEQNGYYVFNEIKDTPKNSSVITAEKCKIFTDAIFEWNLQQKIRRETEDNLRN
ncbi:hypothetical protein [Microbulbifer sp. JMSA003]|uniref:hypothetical protein n=1 Tax=Microbulbifer sp. JMSA003 TaxID=3243369 RepID=UPI00403952DE